MVRTVAILALTGAAILSGVAGGISFALVPMLRTLPEDRLRSARGFLAGRPEPLTPVILAATLLANVVLGVAAPRAGSRAAFAFAAALSLAALTLRLLARLPAARATSLRAANGGWGVLVAAAFLVDVAAALGTGF